MSNTKLQLWVDVNENKLLSGWLSVAERKDLTFRKGDIIDIELHKVKKSSFADGVMEEVYFDIDETVKIAIGSNQSVPTSGTWNLTVGDGTLMNLDYDIKCYELEEKLNSIESLDGEGGVSVSKKDDSTFLVLFNQVGARDLFVASAYNLIPTSTVTVQRIKVGDANTKELQQIKLKCTPVAYTENFVDGDQPAIQTTVINGNITNLSIEPQPRSGTFTISDGINTTGLISIYADSSAVLTALKDAGIADNSNTFVVKKIGSFSWNIQQLTGSVKNLTNVSDILKFNSKLCTLNLNTAEIESEIGSNDSVKLLFEIEISSGGKKSTIYQSKVSFYSDIIQDVTYNPVVFPVSQSISTTGGTMTGQLTLDYNDYTTEVGNGYVYVSQNNIGGGNQNWAVIYAGGIELGNGITGVTLNSTGVYFPDGKLQTTDGIPEAPMDGKAYVRQNGNWVDITTL